MKKTLISIFLLPLVILLYGEYVFCQLNNSGILIADTGERPVIQLDSLENIHIIWYESDIYHSIYDTNGFQILTPRVISSFSTQYADLAIGDDIGIAVWEAWDESSTWLTLIRGQMFAVNGDTIGDNFIINYPQYQLSYRYDPKITHIQNDTFFVVWFCDNGSIYGQVLVDSSISYNNILISDYPILSTQFLPRPKVGSYANCPYIVVIWIDDRGGTPLLYGRKFSITGVPQDSSFLISEVPDIIKVTNSSIVMNTCGEFTVAYIAMGGDSTRKVYCRSLDLTGQPYTSSQVISQSPAGDLIDMAVSTNGNYVVEWEAIFGDRSRIAAQRLQSDGTLIGDNFWVVDIADSVNQYAPSVILHNTDIYSAWYEQDDYTMRVWLNKIDFNNPTTSITGEYSIPSEYLLSRNYPNPFNPVTTIAYAIPERSDVRLIIYDLLGKEVTTLVSGIQEAGFKSVQWNAKNEAGSGVYFYQIRAGEFLQTRKMVFLK